MTDYLQISRKYGQDLSHEAVVGGSSGRKTPLPTQLYLAISHLYAVKRQR